ncbi:MAG: outer membrane beta-barrel protein [Rhizobiaceae bacterium]
MGSSIIQKSLISAALFSAVAIVPTTAHAADLLVDPPVIEAPEVITRQSGGWYLRGDITYDIHSMENPMYSVGGAGTEKTFTSASLKNSYDLGLGIGYQINENFRVDLTGEYVFSSAFTGSTAGECGTYTAPGALLLADGSALGDPNTKFSNCTSTDVSSVSALKLLANAYVDLGNFSGITPYVGAGIGGAYVRWSDLVNTQTCTADVNVDCPVGGIPADTHAGVASWRFAYALHAGFSYDISQNTKLDLGYTYSSIAGGDMFKWLDGSGTQGYDKGITSHVIRAGLRYQIW